MKIIELPEENLNVLIFKFRSAQQRKPTTVLKVRVDFK